MTEPDAGTDSSRIITRATEDGMGGWIVNSRRSGRARRSNPRSACSSLEPTASRASSAVSPLLVDLDPEHCDIAPIPKVGRNAVASCEVAYDDLLWRGGAWSASLAAASTTFSTASTPNESCSPRWRVASVKQQLRRATHYANEREVLDAKSVRTRRCPTHSPRPTWSSTRR